MMIRLTTLSLFALLAIGASAHAQDAAKQPIDVSATQALEWHRADGFVIARGDAVVTRGTDTLKAPFIKAYLSKGSGNKLERVEASGGVTLISPSGTVTGPQGVYEVNTGVATVNGGVVTLVSPEQTVTAQKQMVYDKNGGVVTATGAVHTVRADGTVLDADTQIARFEKGADGKDKLTELEGIGALKLTTKTEVLTAGRGVYKAAQNKAFVYQNVKIVRGQNTIEGDRGETDLTTKISNIYADNKDGSPATPKRVHGVFYQKD